MKKWSVAQIGSRRNYSLPATFERLNKLGVFCTDIWTQGYVVQAARVVGVSERLLSRRNDYIPDKKVITPRLDGIRFNLKMSRRKRDESWYADLMKLAGSVSSRSGRALNNGQFEGHWGFTLECLEAFKRAKKMGLPCVLEQYDPAVLEDRLVLEYSSRHPGWGTGMQLRPDFYFERVYEEWDMADKIIVSSKWSRDCLVAQNVSPEKIEVLPLAINLDLIGPQRAVNTGDSIKVLFLGTFNMRKGAPDFVECARRLQHRKDIIFIVAGPLHIEEELLASFPENISFLGSVARTEVSSLLDSADILLLPAISEGFGIVQLEAASRGVCVMTTKNVGDFVVDGLNGVRLNELDAELMVTKVEMLADNRVLLARLGNGGLNSLKQFGFDSYTKRINNIVSSLENTSF